MTEQDLRSDLLERGTPDQPSTSVTDLGSFSAGLRPNSIYASKNIPKANFIDPHTGIIRLSPWLSLFFRSKEPILRIEIASPNKFEIKSVDSLSRQNSAIDLITALRADFDSAKFHLTEREQRQLEMRLTKAWEANSDANCTCADLVRTVKSTHRYFSDRRSQPLSVYPFTIQVVNGDTSMVEGRPVSVEQVMSSLQAELSHLGANKPAHTKPVVWDRLMLKADQLFPTFQAVLIMQYRGWCSVKSIAEELNLPAPTVRDFFKYGAQHPLRVMRKLARNGALPKTDIHAPLEQSLDWASALGMYQAVTARSGLPNIIRFHFQQRSDAENARDTLTKLSPIVRASVIETNVRDRHRWVTQSYGAPLTNAFRRYTSDNSRLPWEMLETTGEKLAFLRGYFLLTGVARIGHLEKPAYHFESTCHPEVVIGVASLLREFGIVGTIFDGHQMRVSIKHPCYLKRLMEIEVLPPRDLNILRPVVESKKVSECPIERYWRVMTLANNGTDIPQAKIVKLTGVHPMTVHGWIRKGVVPNELRCERELLRAFEAFEVPHSGTTSVLYRLFRLSAADSLRLGVRIPLPVAKRILKDFPAISDWNAERLLEISKAYSPTGERRSALRY